MPHRRTRSHLQKALILSSRKGSNHSINPYMQSLDNCFFHIQAVWQPTMPLGSRVRPIAHRAASLVVNMAPSVGTPQKLFQSRTVWICPRHAKRSSEDAHFFRKRVSKGAWSASHSAASAWAQGEFLPLCYERRFLGSCNEAPTISSDSSCNFKQTV